MKKRPRVSEDATLDAYLREISRFPPLSREEEHELGSRIRRHRDHRAFKRLVEANLRFVVGFAERYRGLGVVFLDLIDEGNLGLMEAARRFDPDHNGKFTTYAAWWIRQAIMHALGEQGRVFAPQGEPEAASALMPQPIARPLDVVDAVIWREMADLFDLDDPGEPQPAFPGRSRPAAPRRPIAEDDGIELGEAFGGQPPAPIEEAMVRRNVVSAVREVLHELAPREREVIRLRLGVDEAPMTIEEIGERLRVPRDRVREIETRARGKLRRSHKARELRSTLN